MRYFGTPRSRQKIIIEKVSAVAEPMWNLDMPDEKPITRGRSKSGYVTHRKEVRKGIRKKEHYSPRPSKRSRLRTRGSISAFRHCRNQSNPKTASQRWRLGSGTNSTQVNDIEFKEVITTSSITEEKDFRGIRVWTKSVDRRDWTTSLDRRTCAAMPARRQPVFGPLLQVDREDPHRPLPNQAVGPSVQLLPVFTLRPSSFMSR